MTASVYTQYNNAPKFNALLDSLDSVLDIDEQAYHDDIFNILTAELWGSKFWAVVLGTQTEYTIYDFQNIFGFGTPNLGAGTAYPQNFGYGSFFSLTPSGAVELNNEALRVANYFTYSKRVLSTTYKNCEQSVNNYIRLTYGENSGKRCVIIQDWIYKDQAREFAYKFNYELSDFEISIFKFGDVLLRPAATSYTVLWEAE